MVVLSLVFPEASTLIPIKDALVSMTTNSGQMFLFSTPSTDDHFFFLMVAILISQDEISKKVLKRFILYLLLFMNVCNPVGPYVHHMCVGACSDHKRASHPLELKLQAVGSNIVGVGN